MSDKKELNVDELEKVTGGSDQIGKEISINDISNYLNTDIYAKMAFTTVFGQLIEASFNGMTVKILVKSSNHESKYEIGQSYDFVTGIWKFYESQSN